MGHGFEVHLVLLSRGYHSQALNAAKDAISSRTGTPERKLAQGGLLYIMVEKASGYDIVDYSNPIYEE